MSPHRTNQTQPREDGPLSDKMPRAQAAHEKNGKGDQGDRENRTRPRGFARMDADRQREIASAGGKAAHAAGMAHEFTPEEARAAGQRGGRKVSEDRAHMAAIGRRGGQLRGRNLQARAAAAGADSSDEATAPSPA